MLKKYKNLIYLSIKHTPLEIEDFFIEEEEYLFKIIYKDTPLHFSFFQEESNYHHFNCQNTVFQKDFPLSSIFPDSPSEFEYISPAFDIWLEEEVDEYRKEQIEPDYWKQLNNKFDLEKHNIDFNDNSNFTNEEKKQITLGLNEARIFLKEEFNFSNTQLEIINQRLLYIEGALDRVNKTDWKSIMISTLIGLITNLGVDTNTASSVWDLFKNIFNNIPSLPAHWY